MNEYARFRSTSFEVKDTGAGWTSGQNGAGRAGRLHQSLGQPPSRMATLCGSLS